MVSPKRVYGRNRGLEGVCVVLEQRAQGPRSTGGVSVAKKHDGASTGTTARNERKHGSEGSLEGRRSVGLLH